MVVSRNTRPPKVLWIDRQDPLHRSVVDLPHLHDHYSSPHLRQPGKIVEFPALTRSESSTDRVSGRTAWQQTCQGRAVRLP